MIPPRKTPAKQTIKTTGNTLVAIVLNASEYTKPLSAEYFTLPKKAGKLKDTKIVKSDNTRAPIYPNTMIPASTKIKPANKLTKKRSVSSNEVSRGRTYRHCNMIADIINDQATITKRSFIHARIFHTVQRLFLEKVKDKLINFVPQ